MNNQIIMKRILLMMMWVLIPVGMMAQSSDFGKICDSYENRKGIESIDISPKAFSFLVPESEVQEKQLFKKMEELKILSVSCDKYKSTADSLREDVLSYIKKNNFQQVMKVKDSQEKLSMYNRTHELIFLALSEDEVAVIYIKGTIDEDLIKAVAEGKIKIE
jgi:hypothetical protein